MSDTPPQYIVLVTAVITACGALLSGIVSAIVSNRMSYKKTYKEKVWELRRQAYGEIVSSLSAVERILDGIDESIAHIGVFDYFDNHSGGDSKKIGPHISVVRKTFSEYYLIFSKEFIEYFEEFLSILDDPGYNLDPSEEHEQFAAAVRKFRPKLLQQARSEIQEQKLWLARLGARIGLIK